MRLTQLKPAEAPLKEFVTYSQQMGCEVLESIATGLLGVISIAEGQMSQGLKMLEQSRQMSLEYESPVLYAQCEYILGNVYLQIVERAEPMSFSTVAKNIGFLVRNVPSAGKKAEEHFNKAIAVYEEIGTNGFLALAYLDLGLLYKTRKRTDQARQFISQAIQIFEECEAEEHLARAKEAFLSLG